MKKRLLALALSLCLVVAGISGCGKQEKDSSSSSGSSAVSSVTTTAPTPEQTAKAVLVNADGGLNIRSKPSTDGEILDTAENGSKLPLLVETPTDGWYQIEYSGQTAYVSAEYASVVDVTLEEYNRLRAGDTTSSAPAQNSDDPQATSSAASGSTTATPSPSPSTGGNEDGE